MTALLDVEGLTVEFRTRSGSLRAVDDVAFQVREGEVVGLVGESGSGKSVTALAAMGLISRPGHVSARRLALDGRDLASLDAGARRRVNGRELAMIFQEPLTSLNPCFTVGFQIMEAIRIHDGGGRRARRARAIELLDQVGIPDPESRLRSFPHQLSGGMNQRAMIAMAIACNPRLLIADEPTTALDVTIQAQILDLMRTLQRESEQRMSIVFITHDLGVVAEMADRVVVMYGGRVVEEGTAFDVFKTPRHPYTIGLLNSIPRPAAHGRGDREGYRLEAIPGNVPNPENLPPGCAFEPRCAHAVAACGDAPPALSETARGHRSRCIRWREL